MLEGNRESTGTPDRPGRGGRERQAIWIRPGGSSLELGKRAPQPPAASSIPSTRSIFRLGFHLVGVGIIVLSACYFLANGSRDSAIPQPVSLSPTISIPVESAVCLDIERCLSKRPAVGEAPVSATPVAFRQTPVSTSKPPPPPQPTAEPTPRPLPISTPTPDPTPSAPLLVVAPQSLTVSRKDVCNAGASVPLTLMNEGGELLLWSEDTGHTSRGMHISDPSGRYLIMPDQSVSATVRCRRGLPLAQYRLVIDFNGGEVSVPVTIVR